MSRVVRVAWAHIPLRCPPARKTGLSQIKLRIGGRTGTQCNLIVCIFSSIARKQLAATKQVTNTPQRLAAFKGVVCSKTSDRAQLCSEIGHLCGKEETDNSCCLLNSSPKYIGKRRKFYCSFTDKAWGLLQDQLGQDFNANAISWYRVRQFAKIIIEGFNINYIKPASVNPFFRFCLKMKTTFARRRRTVTSLGSHSSVTFLIPPICSSACRAHQVIVQRGGCSSARVTRKSSLDDVVRLPPAVEHCL